MCTRCVHQPSGGREDRWGWTKGGLLKTGQEEVCCIKMAEEKWETNTQMAGLNNLPYFPWITAIVASAKGSGQHFCCCCCWTHVNMSTSGCGFNTSALRLNQCCCCVSSPLLMGAWDFSFYLGRLAWPLVLGPLQLGRPHPPLFP